MEMQLELEYMNYPN